MRRILAIGNSFSDDVTYFLQQIRDAVRAVPRADG